MSKKRYIPSFYTGPITISAQSFPGDKKKPTNVVKVKAALVSQVAFSEHKHMPLMYS
jgi:hypothetical protein